MFMTDSSLGDDAVTWQRPRSGHPMGSDSVIVQTLYQTLGLLPGMTFSVLAAVAVAAGLLALVLAIFLIQASGRSGAGQRQGTGRAGGGERGGQDGELWGV